MIEKNILRKAVKDILLEYMEKGSVKPGERISLPELANELEVSATPLREALTQLTETGLVTYIANRGFFVSSLHEQEAIEIYELITILESQAVLASDFSSADLKELEIINAQFKTAEDSISKLRTDRLFHQKLIQNYPNQAAKKIIEDIRMRVFIYEFEFMESSSIEESVQMHQEIIDKLKQNKRDMAISILKSNWEISKNQILQNFQTKPS